MRLGMPDLHRTNVHILFVLLEAKSSIGEGNNANDDKDDADDASWFHKGLKLRAGRRRD